MHYDVIQEIQVEIHSLPHTGSIIDSDTKLRQAMQCRFAWITSLQREHDVVIVSLLVTVPSHMLNFQLR